MKRRDFLLSAGAAMGAAGTAGLWAGKARAVDEYDLTIQNASYRFRDIPTPGLVSVAPDAPPPVLYGRQGVPMRISVTNGLPDYTAMHWHGLRIGNAMDGVPYLTQFPIAGGETYRYEFTPPDAGTYWYHPHCMTMSQMAHGLTGMMVIAEAEAPGFSSEQAVNLRDFRLADDGSLLPYFTARGAARAGTFGNVQTANWRQGPVYDHPAGGLVRLRIAATDTTRIYKLRLDGLEEGAGRIIAWDGHPLRESLPLPLAEAPLVLACGQRVDIAIRMPREEGRTVTLLADLPGRPARPMASLRATGADQGRDLAEIGPLPANAVALPDLEQAELHEFVFGWAPDDLVPKNGFCGSLGYTFWSINRTPWAGDAAKGVGPLATLELGKSYVLRLRNESPNMHPIHLHGLSFLPLRSNLRRIPANFTDTALLLKNEVMEVALVADNPGDWAFHCHVIEHQKTGLTGYLRVT